jgi:hypothetical protein
MDFEYKIENGEVTIVGYSNVLATEINIPKTIDGYPVTNISDSAFYGLELLIYLTIPKSINFISYNALFGCAFLNRINDIEIINGFCIINDRFIFDYETIYRIKHQIGDDYCVFNCYRDGYMYFLDNEKYGEYFKY